MIRHEIVLLVVLVTAVPGRAEEVRGRLKKVDAGNGVVTLRLGTPGGAVVPDRDFVITRKTRIVDLSGKELKDRLGDRFFAKPGGLVTVTTEKKNGREVVTRVKAGVEPPK